jgi:TatD DNase family protein
MTFIDSHAHLDLPEFKSDRHETIQRALENGIEKIITIGIGINECKEALKIAACYSSVFVAIGIHPHNAKTLDLNTLEFIERHAKNEKVVALGEMGLDFFRNLSPKQDQIRCFRVQLELAQILHLPVIVHDREAHEETVSILREEKARDAGGVLHCFSGNSRMAFNCIDMGFYISIPGTVTFKNARTLHEVVRKVPLKNLLIETDCPFLAPVPFRGKRNEPAYVKLVAEKIAQIKHIPLDKVAHITTQNTKRLFSLL